MKMDKSGAITDLMLATGTAAHALIDVVNGTAGIKKGEEGAVLLIHAEELVRLATAIRMLQWLQSKDAN
jgi:hypothetical protein